ncbi:DegQ family serine endoprotease [Chitinimonas arctica]|uniref:Probable periplasmic serine endoprotease DegP-like n=1 Tax=Chitinimonas arctica TaxID=2594795 RepID=A0A516SBL3_9NEIS|nr:DegQ family serine endoprotease [Chitinimonas arctica]QDQ25539.1 DegQ family serine endoprotease [Chitinimonas arctica]
MKHSLLTALLFACGLTACTEAAAVETPSKVAALAPAVAATAAPLVAGLPDFSALVDREGRAVVNISTTQTIRANRNQMPEFGEDDPFEFFRRFGLPVPPGGQQQRPGPQRDETAKSLGSGFIFDADGYVLTNAHVVANADEITVKLIDKREFKAKVIGADARTDVAVLKIEAKGLPVVDLGSSEKLKVGEWVVAIGSPFGLDNSVTAGIVSGKGRNLPDENFVPFIQTDAAVNPGNSGGPLFNVRGEVVGINSQIFSRSGGYMGLSFAIPIDTAMQIVNQLKSHGKVTRGRMGVTIQPLTDDLARDFGLKSGKGALINNVEADAPAGKAGIKAGDVILKFNGVEIGDGADLQRTVGATKPGASVPVEIWRDKAAKTLTVTVVELEQAADGRSAQRERKADRKSEAGAKSGLAVREADPRLLRQLGLKFGLQVVDVNGPAARAGIQPGDVIVGIAGEDVKSLAHLDGVLSAAKAGSSVALRIRRGEAAMFVSLKLGDKSEKSSD